MIENRAFPRSFDSLDAIVAFTATFFAGAGIDASLRPAVDLALEELFTNMVKYGGPSRADVDIAMASIPGGVEVTLTDRDAGPFDVTRAPDVDVTRPIEERSPGGLGLHLVRRMLDSIEYDYLPERRQGRTVFRKTLGQGPGSGAQPISGGDRARD
jgi:anti-sigma regulatory factor (Ser/Thr protein kinase)